MTSAKILPVTDFRNKIKDILAQVKEFPVILTQRSRPTAVVIDYETYLEREKMLEVLELKLDDMILAQAVKTSQEMVSLDELLVDYERTTGQKIG